MIQECPCIKQNLQLQEGAIMVNYRNLAYFGKYPFNDNVVCSKPNQAQGNKQEFGITKWFSKVLQWTKVNFGQLSFYQRFTFLPPFFVHKIINDFVSQSDKIS